MASVRSADGTAIAFERAGAGPPIVLVHGTGGDRARWARVVPLLAPDFTVYAVDRRGRGGSGDGAAYALAREVEDVLAVLGAIGEPAHLFGHSYGAIICLEAARAGADLRTLILYEPPFTAGVDRVPTDLGDRLAALLDAGDLDALVELFLREGPRRSLAEIAAMRGEAEWAARVASAATLPRETRTVNAYAFEPAAVAGVRVPTLLLLGGESPQFFGETTRALHAALPQSAVAILPGQRHNAMDTAPAMLADAVRGFLAEHAGVRG